MDHFVRHLSVRLTICEIVMALCSSNTGVFVSQHFTTKRKFTITINNI